MYYIYVDGNLLNQPLEDSLIVMNAKLTLELGKAGSLEFSVPQTNTYYNKLHKLRTLVTVCSDETELFRGRVLSHERDFANVKKIYAEGDLAYLIDSVQKSEKFSGTTHELFRKIVTQHNAQMNAEKRFEIGDITIEDRSIFIAGQSDDVEDLDTGEFDYRQIAINATSNEWVTTYDYIESCIVKYCGGYLRTRRVGSVTYLDLVTECGNAATQEISFGTNILDMTEEATAEEVFTVLIPIGDKNLTIASVNHGSEELIDHAAVELYGRIVKSHVFDNVNQPATLLENAQQFMANHENVPITFKINAVDMHVANSDVQEICVGDQVHIKSAPHGLSNTLTCTKIEYDLHDPSKNTYTFGNPKQTLTQRYREDKQKSSGGGGGGGGGGGSVAGAVGETVVEEADKALQDFYDAWINIDAESGHVDLGTLYNQLQDAKEVLSIKTGIDLNSRPLPGESNVNIYSLRTAVDDATGAVQQNATSIHMITEELHSEVSIWASAREELNGQIDNAISQLTLVTDGLDNAIGKLGTEIGTRIAEVELISTQTLASAVLKTEYSTNRTADLKLISDATQSIATLQADHDGKIASLEASVSDIESKTVLKTEYDSNKNSTLTLISDTKKSIADLKSEHDNKISSLTTTVTDGLASAVLKTVYNTNRTADLKLISDATQSIATLQADHDGKIASLEASVSGIESKTVLKTEYDSKIATIETKANKLESSITANADLIKLCATTATLDASITTINDKITVINATISGIDTLIAEKIAAHSIDVSKLEGCTITARAINASNVRADRSIHGKTIYVDNKTVATEEYVNGKISSLVTAEWIADQGYATQTYVNNRNAWGKAQATGKYWCKIGGASKVIALGNHTHSTYCTEARVKELIAAAIR